MGRCQIPYGRSAYTLDTDRQTFVVNYEISDLYYKMFPESNLAETNYFEVNCLIWSELPNIECTIVVTQQISNFLGHARC